MAMNRQEIVVNFRSLVQAEPITSALTVLVVVLLIFTMWLSARVSKLTKGSDGRSLEGTIKALSERTSALESYARKNQQTVSTMEVRLARSVQSIATERFDPFQNSGGQQSFATAFLNEHGDGVIVSGIHSRDHMRVYAKPVVKFASERELSEEEAKAIAKAKRDLTN